MINQTRSNGSTNFAELERSEVSLRDMRTRRRRTAASGGRRGCSLLRDRLTAHSAAFDNEGNLSFIEPAIRLAAGAAPGEDQIDRFGAGHGG